jgi:hypothetical protein
VLPAAAATNVATHQLGSDSLYWLMMVLSTTKPGANSRQLSQHACVMEGGQAGTALSIAIHG